jgi:hypothetical protein
VLKNYGEMTNNNNKYKPMSHGLENPSMNLSIVIGKKGFGIASPSHNIFGDPSVV